MPPFFALAMVVLSVGVLVGSGTMLVAVARGYDWYSAEGARHMRRATLVQGISLAVGAAVAAALLASSGQTTARWALPTGAGIIVLMVVLVVMAWRKGPLDPAARELREGSAVRWRLTITFAMPLAAAGIVLMILGAVLDWPFGLGVGIPLLLLSGLFAVLVRLDWPAAAFRRRAEGGRKQG